MQCKIRVLRISIGWSEEGTCLSLERESMKSVNLRYLFYGHLGYDCAVTSLATRKVFIFNVIYALVWPQRSP
jgi:hypothetical protein